MSRVIWKGSISFGLVHVPIALDSGEEQDELPLSMLDRRVANHRDRGFRFGGGDTSRNIRSRLEHLRRDPWEGYFSAHQSITKSMNKTLGLA